MLVPLPSNEAEVKTPGDPQSCADVDSFVLEQAQELQESLSPDYPSFLKLLCPSHLSVKFDLGLPKKFSHEHLPSRDDTIILVDENEQEFTAKFSVHKSRLSGGWRGFSISHNLQAGDILVFQLIEPRKFKVHIVRVNSSDVVNATLCLMNMDASRRGANYEDLTKEDDMKAENESDKDKKLVPEL